MGYLTGRGKKEKGAKTLGYHISLVMKRELLHDPTFQGDRASLTEHRACKETQL